VTINWNTLRSTIIVLCFLFSGTSAASQGPVPSPQQSENGLRVFLDCSFTCDADFVRTEIPIIDYMRDRRDADVHVLLTRQPSAGGTEYSVAFIGLNRFAGIDATLKYVASQTSTQDEQRRGIVALLKLGLVRYLAETSLADRIAITFAHAPNAAVRAGTDPWNLWVFRTTFGATVTGERANKGRSVRAGISVNRTSDAWKVTLSTSGNYRDDTFALNDAESFKSVSRSFNVTGAAVKSLTEHWSAGVHGSGLSSTFLNYDRKTRFAPGVEYNIFPYSQSTRRMLTTQYTLGMGQAEYHEETIFGKTSERLVDHRLAVSLTMREPWGTGSAEVSVSQFLNRPNHYNATAIGSANVRVYRGLSISLFSSLSRTNDQLYLPRTVSTTEEILVRQRQLATSYRYSVNVGLTYSFGSIFNNVVNQRFGSAGEDLPEF
jgi:hypothetical protein